MVSKFEKEKPSEYIFSVLLCLAQLGEERALHALTLSVLLMTLEPLANLFELDRGLQVGRCSTSYTYHETRQKQNKEKLLLCLVGKNSALTCSSLGTGKSTAELSFTEHQELVPRGGQDLHWLWDSRAVHAAEQGPSRLCLQPDKLIFAVPEPPFPGSRYLRGCDSL